MPREALTNRDDRYRATAIVVFSLLLATGVPALKIAMVLLQ